MDFSAGPELEQIELEARRLADQFDDDYWRDHDEKHEFPWEFYNAFAEQGWMGVVVPEEYGGAGMGIMHAAVLLGTVGHSAGVQNAASALHLSIFGMGPVIHHGAEELKQRYLYAQAMETARCLEENVLETPQDADLGAIYGWGFPAWTGGTISYIDTIGIKTFVQESDRLAQLYGPRFLPSAWLRDKAARGEDFYTPASETTVKEPVPA